jgi:hypothetical protein
MVPVRSRCGSVSLTILAFVIGFGGLFILRALVAGQDEKAAWRLLPLSTPEFWPTVAALAGLVEPAAGTLVALGLGARDTR